MLLLVRQQHTPSLFLGTAEPHYTISLALKCQACLCRVQLRPVFRFQPAWTSLRQFRPA